MSPNRPANSPIYTKLEGCENLVILYLNILPSTSVVVIWDTVTKTEIRIIQIKDEQNNDVRARFLLYTTINGITYSIGVVVGSGDLMKFNITINQNGELSLSLDTQWGVGGKLSLDGYILPAESALNGKWVLTLTTESRCSNTASNSHAKIVDPQTAEIQDLGTTNNQNVFSGYGADPTGSLAYLVQGNRCGGVANYYAAIPPSNDRVIGLVGLKLYVLLYGDYLAYLHITARTIHVVINSVSKDRNLFIDVYIIL